MGTGTTGARGRHRSRPLRQAGALDAAAIRALARYHRPLIMDPHGRVGAEAVAEFELAPVGELIG